MSYRVARSDGAECEVSNIASLEARVAGFDRYHLALPIHLYHLNTNERRTRLG